MRPRFGRGLFKRLAANESRLREKENLRCGKRFKCVLASVEACSNASPRMNRGSAKRKTSAAENANRAPILRHVVVFPRALC
jgi:hypothetical protein